MFACYDLCAVLTPCGPLKYLLNLIQDKQAPLPGLIYEADVRDGVTNAEHRQQQQQQQQQRQKATERARRTSSSNTSSSSDARPAPAPAARPSPARPAPPMAAPVPVPSVPPMAVAVPTHVDAAAVPVLSDRPRNVAESNFSTYDCETMDELVSLLSIFYETFSPEDTWKARQVAEKFFPTQERLWLLIFHKYMVCSCSMDMPCPVQARHDRRQRAREEEEEDKTIKLGLGDFIFYSVLVGRAAIKDFSTFAVTFLCIVMVGSWSCGCRG